MEIRSTNLTRYRPRGITDPNKEMKPNMSR